MAKHTQTEHIDSTPVSGETAKKLLEHIGITEAEARALIALQAPSDDQLHDLQRVNVPSISAAFSSNATAALINDPKLELPTSGDKITASADHVRFLVHLNDKLETLTHSVIAAARVDADSLQHVASIAVPQLKSRIRVNPALRETFAALLAYHHGRWPGSHHAGATAAPSPASVPTRS